MKKSLGLAVCLATSCATAAKAPAPPPEPLAAVAYYPVAKTNAWAHLVTNHATGADPVLVTSRITDVQSDSFAVTSGAEEIRYERRADGIFKPKSGYYMIKDPVAVGTEWPMPEGAGHVRITDVTAEITVSASCQRGCVVVVEELPGQQRAEWTYAPRLGPIRMRVWDLSAQPPKLLVSGELKAYQVEPAGR